MEIYPVEVEAHPTFQDGAFLEDQLGFDQRAGHFRPPGLVEGIAKLSVLQGLRCFYLGPSSAGVAGAMIKAYAVCGGRAMFLNL